MEGKREIAYLDRVRVVPWVLLPQRQKRSTGQRTKGRFTFWSSFPRDKQNLKKHVFCDGSCSTRELCIKRVLYLFMCLLRRGQILVLFVCFWAVSFRYQCRETLNPDSQKFLSLPPPPPPDNRCFWDEPLVCEPRPDLYSGSRTSSLETSLDSYLTPSLLRVSKSMESSTTDGLEESHLLKPRVEDEPPLIFS